MAMHRLRLRWWKGLLFTALAALPGCSYDAGTLTAIATRNVSLPTQSLGREVQGSDCVYFLFGTPISGSAFPSIQEAIDDALSQEPQGDALTNVVFYLDSVPFGRCLRVKGDVVQVAAQTPTGSSTKGFDQ